MLGRVAPVRRSFSRLFRLEPVCDLINFFEESSAFLLAILFRDALRVRESVIAVEPVDDLERTVDRLEVAVLKPVKELEEHLLEPGDLQPGEVFGRRDPTVAQLLPQDALGSFASQPFCCADFVDPRAGDERGENPLGAGHP